MARSNGDRNLLVGILALQMDFVTRDALFEAMQAWLFRKDTPLGALLVERGDLAKSRRDLLEALVEEHIQAHGGDPAKSLQALTSVGPVATDLGQFSDPDIRASVVHLRIPETDNPLLDSMATRAPTSLGEPTSWKGRFRVVRPHASGGLGVVSVALDDELDREVAFKEIKDRYADDRGKQARFILEAEITGKLEHPGIIPIYGLGHDPTGRPFYAMRFIRGDSLADAIHRYHDPNGPFLNPTKRSLQLRELLGRFLDVCDALAYAHSRGVLHRDLKPGNIMLGPFGETLVVDWGLALPLDRIPEGHESVHGPVKSTKADSSSLPSEQGQVVGTAHYMSPEQAEGAIEKLGPRSDVYGLGAILYDLLTGKHPVHGTSLEEVLRHVAKGEIQPPRQIRPEIHPALEAICLKALSFQPNDRYPTPRALAADLKAWLADEPVSARREPFAERARRWARRNRTAVTAVAASLLVGIIGLGAVAAVQTKARHDLALKNVALDNARQNLALQNVALDNARQNLAQKNSALTASNEALDKQRLRAEDREAQAIAAVKKFGDVIANEPELKNTPALRSLRKRLLNEPLAFFRALRERLQADRDTRPESLSRLANASFSLGFITREISNKQDALIAYRESLAILQKLAHANPNVIEFQRRLANNHNNIGILLKETGKPSEAMESHQAALAIQQKLAQANPDVTDFQSRLTDSHNNIGNLLNETGKPTQAMESHQAALAIRQKLAQANPDVTDFQNRLADSHHNIGVLLKETGKPSEAMESHQAALAIWQKLAQANPDVTQFQSGLALSHNIIGILLSETGKPSEALEFYQAALAILQKLAQANPDVTDFQNRLADSHNNIGVLLSETGKPTQALESYQSALAIRQKLAQANPDVTQFQSRLADSHHNIGNLLSATGKPTQAMESHQAALAIQQKLAQEHPDSPAFSSLLGGTLHNMAMIDLAAQRYEKAQVRLREAVQWQRKALASNPASPTYRQFLSSHLRNLIKAAKGLGDSEGVAEAERELAKLRDSDPAMVALDARLAAILRGDPPRDNPERLRLAQRAYDKTLHTTAARLWADALDSEPKLAEDRKAEHCYNAACAASLAGSGQGKDDPAPDDAAKAKLREQARVWLQAELATWTRFVESGPPQARPVIVQTLQHWKKDSDLAGVRAWEALAQSEREAWRSLWTEVDGLLARAQASLAPVGEK